MPAPDRRLITKILILRRLRRKLKRKVRAASIRPMFWNRVDQGDIILMKELREDPHYHHRYFRMNMENFDEILMLITGEITGKMTHSRPISVEEKLGITLRHENGKLGLPEPKIVGPHLQPHVIVADDAFALKPYMMKPFPGKFLTLERRIYNYRLSRARNVSENAFGMLAARWRIFHTPIVASLDLTRLVIHAAVILHNLLIDKQDMNTITADSDDGNTTGNWRETTTGDTGMISLRQQGSNNRRLEAVLVRDRFLEYFNSNEGSVSWQMSRIS
ncbi:hypothetical protein Fcan01_13952 [Folsomia candida]|uniref:DDE Tnp4 domain-containing protein n=1 Tax=Folsomia candida TaxID=158441 RepID=A0A226E1H4_FOLCA|nr:hypothetical protein Fcan01_13952 [Folsomia candida]